MANEKKYHVNKQTGRAGICRATKKGCPLGDDTPHFVTKEQAKEYIEKREAANHSQFTTINKKSLNTSNSDNNITNELQKFSTYFSPKIPVISDADAENNVHKLFQEYENIAFQELELAGKKTDLIYNTLIEDYTFTGSREWNAALRGHDVDDYYTGGAGYRDEEDKERMRQISLQKARQFNTMINKYGGENMKLRKLYRYIKVPDNLAPEEYAEQLTSDNTLMDKGFVSTTEDPGFIAAHLTNKRNKKNNYIMLEMLTTKGISVNTYEEQGASIQSVEQERVLPTNVKFSVFGKSQKKITAGADRMELLEQTGHFTGRNVNKNIYTIELVDADLLS